MPWRERIIEYLRGQRTELQRRIELLSSGKFQLMEITDGESKDVTEEHIAKLHNHLAEVEQILTEEGLS